MRSYIDGLGSAFAFSLVLVASPFSFETYTEIPMHDCPVDSVF